MQAQRTRACSSLAGVLLGAAAAVAGAPQLGTAIMAGGATVAQTRLPQVQPRPGAGGRPGRRHLPAALQMSPEGLLEFFHVLETPEPAHQRGRQSVPAHPSADPRPDHCSSSSRWPPRPTAALRPIPATGRPTSAAWPSSTASSTNPAQVLRATDERQRARIATRGPSPTTALPDLDQGTGLVDGLIAEQPKDPYFHELKGQILFENGRIAECGGALPRGGALSAGFGAAPLRPRARADRGRPEHAIWRRPRRCCEEAVRIEPLNAGAWRFLGIAEGRRGREGPAALALAEQAVLVGNRKDAEFYHPARPAAISSRTTRAGSGCRTSRARPRRWTGARRADGRPLVIGSPATDLR